MNPTSEKTAGATASALPLQKMFDAVPRRYDLINRLMTLAFDQLWRRQTAAECLAGQPRRVLDLCTGTGDLALQMAALAGPEAEIVGLDFSQPMLDVAIRKANASRRPRPVEFLPGDAGRMPFPDEHFDVIGIAFAFRNLTFRNPRTALYLSEIRRVLKRGGKFVIVETSQPRCTLWRWLFHAYLTVVVWPLGWLLSGQRGAYRYLTWSMKRYYTRDELIALLTGEGFASVTARPLLGGVAALHVAIK